MNKTIQQALRFLTRREYSEQELKQRLAKTYTVDEVNAAITWCKTQGFLSNERFIESRIRHRIQQAYGPRFIAQDLSLHGIEAELIASHLIDEDDFWIEQASQVLAKKYRSFSADERMRAQRYLYQRGFSGSQIQAAIKQVLTVKELREYDEENG
jgi:regulatory protein